ncbi:ATP-binding protein [Companilactobacillus nuruki]|uniref:ATP-binding protein n=1 Tax=Companilactobacillus nuruki TaxID=1993540 RepID=UPI0014170610|nr:AAA family ATPase [Companilactobacillus nuruki]
MKLVKANIYGFGKWIDQEFNFEQDYQVIVGSNEAGKTTLLNFIQSILFGFASARGENKFLQYKPKNSSRYGGELVFKSDDQSIWTVKRIDGKGDGEVTLFHDEQQVPKTLLSEIIGNFTKDDFENTHIFDDRSILSIYSLDEKQLENEVMSVGAVGSKEWLQTAEQLNHEAEDIYKQRGQKQPLVVNLKRQDKLLEEKAEIENQQAAYQRVKNQLDQTEKNFSDNELLLNQATEKENNLRNLEKKWLRYEQLQQTGSQTDERQVISDEDWESVLKANQELSTLKETPTANKISELDNVEKQILNNYRTNQTRLDYVRNQKFELQNLQFHRDDMNSKLLKVDTQVDQLFKNHPELSEEMVPLTSEEIEALAKPSPKINNLPLIIVAISIVLAFVISPLRILFALVAIAGAIWYWYQNYSGKTKNDVNGYAFLQQKGYGNLNPETILNLQSTVISLDNFHTTQNSLIDGIKAIEVDLNKWRKILIELDVLDESYKDDNYNEQIEKYFIRLDQIRAKADLAQQNQAETQKIADEKNRRLRELNKEIFAVLQKYQVVNMNSFIQMRTQQIENKKVITQIKQDKDFLGNDLSELKKYSDYSQLTKELTKAANIKNQLADKNNELSRQMGSLKEQMQQIMDNNRYQHMVEELAQNEADIIDNYDEWLSKKLASQWIRNMLNNATKNRYPKMIDKATQYFDLLTNHNYVKIDFSKSGIIVTSAKKNRFDVHELSKATTIQLYISLRLAFVTEIADLVKLPILIDDAFVDFDSSRTENVFKLVQKIAQNNQVIYVTANEPNVPDDHIMKLEDVVSA